VKIGIRVESSAAKYIDQFMRASDNGDPLVIAISQEVVHEPQHVSEFESGGGSGTIDALVARGKEIFKAFPSRIQIRWIVGAARKDRFPAADIHLVDGVWLYLPSETNDLLGDRVLKVNHGVLYFDPPLGAIEDMQIKK